MKTLTVIFAALLIIAVMLVACETPTSTQTFPSTYKLTPEQERQEKSMHASKRTNLLKLGMSETEVISLLGDPDKISISTCGAKTGKPWTCKIHEYTSPEYGYSGNILYEKTRVTVFYGQFLDDWHLNSFTTH